MRQERRSVVSLRRGRCGAFAGVRRGRLEPRTAPCALYGAAIEDYAKLPHRPGLALSHLALTELFLEHYPDEHDAVIAAPVGLGSALTDVAAHVLADLVIGAAMPITNQAKWAT